MANEYLQRTPTSTGNRKVFTWSGWVKSNIDNNSGTGNAIFICASANNGNLYYRTRIGRFVATGNDFGLNHYDGANDNYGTGALKRDHSNWEHYICAVDTTKEQTSDRVKLYLNGVYQSDLSTVTAINQNLDTYMNGASIHFLGADGWTASPNSYAKLLMSDVFLVDGQALTPDVFGFYKDGDGYMSSGTTRATDFRPGQWMPHAPRVIKKSIERSGGFGVNGFYLPMNDSSNPGADFHCAPNSIIKLKGEDLPQPRNGAPTTSDAYVSQLRPEKEGTLGFDGVAKFDGDGDSLDVGSVGDFNFLHNDTSVWTAECWVHPQVVNSRQTIFSTGGNSSSTGFCTRIMETGSTGGGNGYYVSAQISKSSSGNYLYWDSNPVRLGSDRWYHLAFVYDNSNNTLKIYVDGVLTNGTGTATESGSFGSHSTSNSSNSLHIGEEQSGDSLNLTGFISNLRIVNGTAVYTSNFTPPTEPLTNITNTTLLCCNSVSSLTAATVTPGTITNNGGVVSGKNEIDTCLVLAVPGISTATGANLVTNGHFDTNTTGWVSEQSATLSVDNGRLKVLTTNTSYGSANQTVTGLEVGKRYSFSVDMFHSGVNNASIVTVITSASGLNILSGWQSTDYKWKTSFVADNTSILLDFQMASHTGIYGFWDNVILKQEDAPRDYSADIRGSGTNKTLTAAGSAGVGYELGGYYGSAMTFDGSGDYFDTPESNNEYDLDGDYTIEFWVNFNTISSVNDIIGTANNSVYLGSGKSGWIIGYATFTNVGFRIGYQSNSSWVFEHHTGITAVANQWYHIAISRSGSTQQFIINGVVVRTDTQTNTLTSTDNVLRVGGGFGSTSGLLNGQIQDLRIYKGLAKYKGGFDVPKPYTPVGIEAFRTTADTCKNNFATFNPLKRTSNQTLSDGNLTCTQAGQVWGACASTIGMDESSGKYYVEYRVASNIYSYIGIANANSLVFDLATVPSGYTFMGATSNDWGYLSSSGGIQHNNSNLVSGGAILNAGDILGITFDTSNKEAKWYANGVLQYTTTLTGNYPFFFASGSYESSNIVNFGQNPSFSGQVTAGTNADDSGKGLFKYAPPSGFLALCEDNLPTPAIADPGKHFKSVLYTGSGSARNVTGVGFKPDFVWMKGRTGSGYNHLVNDSVRGPRKTLFTNNSLQEYTDRGVTSFDNDGFSLIGGGSSDENATNVPYVAWCWKAGGAAVSNNDGTLTSQVSVNHDAGFSIVKFTAQTSGTGTVGHGLSKKPAFWIYKPHTNTTNWYMYHQSLGASAWLNFSTTQATTGNAAAWGGVEPTSTVLTHGDGLINQGSCILYAWTEIEGFSKFGSYVGNNNADGPFVYCGFKPAFIMFKNASATGNWVMSDSSRDSSNPVFGYQVAEGSGIEERGTALFDSLSNGFKIRNAWTSFNGNTNTIIFMAFAESPFQTANAK